jgi:hypothetical protein
MTKSKSEEILADKKLNHLSFQSTEQLNKNVIKRDKSGKSSSQIVPRIWNLFLFVFECVSVFMNYKDSGVGI